MNWWTVLRALGLLTQLRGALRDPEFPLVLEDGDYDYAEDPFMCEPVACATEEAEW
jgi:hypothetical protein